MTATLLTAATPYTPWGTRQWYAIPTISNINAPTTTELNTGSTDLTPQVTEVTGFTQTGSTVESQSFVGPALKLPGPSALDDSAISGRMSKTSTDIRDVLPFGYSGYIVQFPDGNTAGRKMDVFKVQVNGNPIGQGLTDAATYTANIAVLGAAFGVTIP